MAELGDLLACGSATGRADPSTITPEMVDYSYVEKCNDVKVLRGILFALKSGTYGSYPKLEEVTEQKILSVLPDKERRQMERLRKVVSPVEVAQEEQGLAEWLSSISKADSGLRGMKGVEGPSANSLRQQDSNKAVFPEVNSVMDNGAPSSQDVDSDRQRVIPPVRGKGAPSSSGSSSHQSTTGSNTSNWEESSAAKANRISGYDFRAWEKFDVDAACAELEDAESNRVKKVQEMERYRQEKEARRRQELLRDQRQLQDKLNVHVFSEIERKVHAEKEKQKGNEAFHAGQQEEAYSHYSRSLAYDPDNAVVYANRAMVCLRLERLEQAETDCTMALEKDPKYLKARMRRGLTRYRRGKYAEAVKDLQKATEAAATTKEKQEITMLLEKAKAKYVEVEGDRARQELGLAPSKLANGLKATTKQKTQQQQQPKPEPAKDDFFDVPVKVCNVPTSAAPRKSIMKGTMDPIAAKDTHPSVETTARAEATGQPNPSPPTRQGVMRRVVIVEESDDEDDDQAIEGAVEPIANVSEGAGIDDRSNNDIGAADDVGRADRTEVEDVTAETPVEQAMRRVVVEEEEEPEEAQAATEEEMEGASPGPSDSEEAAPAEITEDVPTMRRVAIVEEEEEDQVQEKEQGTEDGVKEPAKPEVGEVKQAQLPGPAAPLVESKAETGEAKGAGEKTSEQKSPTKVPRTGSQPAAPRPPQQQEQQQANKVACEVEALKESDRLKDLGNQAMQGGDAKAAVKFYTDSLIKNPRNTAALNNRAQAHLKLRSWADAEADASEVLRIDHNNVKALYRRGKARCLRAAQVGAGKEAEAVAALEGAVEDFSRIRSLEPTNKVARQEYDAALGLLSKAKTTQSLAKADQKKRQPSSVATSEPLEVLAAQRAADEQPYVRRPPYSTAASASAHQPAGPLIKEVFTRARGQEAGSSASEAKLPPREQMEKQKSSTLPARLAPAAVADSKTRAKGSASIASTVRRVKPTVPEKPPTSSYELEVTWKSLRMDLALFAEYLKTFKIGTFGRVFLNSTDADVLTDVYRAVDEHLVASDADRARFVMEYMTRIGHFDMMMMMASQSEKDRISRILRKLEQTHGAPAIQPLRRKYRC